MYYYTITNFKLPRKIQQVLENIDWKILPVASKFNKIQLLKMLIRNKILINGLFHYGILLQDASTLVSTRLPQDLEKLVRQYLEKKFGSLLATEAIIRLQVVYGGKIVPIHIDLTKQSSIVYPIKHKHTSSTLFYNCKRVNTRELIDPKKCTLYEEVSVTDMPVLLDTNVPHAVKYSKNLYTYDDPRISLSIKFEKLTFSTVHKELIKADIK